MEKFIDFAAQFISIDKEIVECIHNSFKRIELKKKQLLISEGQECNVIGFVINGGFRLYSNNDGVEKNFDFVFETGLVTDYRSFLTGEPSCFNIQAIEDSEIITIHKQVHNKLLEENMKWEQLTRLLDEQLYIYENERFHSLLNDSPETHYLKIIKKYPHFLQRVSQTNLASYFGITRETLSRIRKRVNK